MEQGQDLGRAAADVFVRLEGGLAARPPRHTGMRHGLEGAGLVLTPDREPKLRPQRVGLLDQLFLAIASGSLTRTTPGLRWRITTPVSHQVRPFCQLRPPACKGFEICIDGLSFWLMRIAREIGCGTSVQALRERRACQKWADAHQAALPV